MFGAVAESATALLSGREGVKKRKVKIHDKL